jgi:uncharacterized protein (TIGR02001 family)
VRLLAPPRRQPSPLHSDSDDVLALPTPQTVVRLACISALVLLGAARAQTGGSIAVESDYRFRGVSLSGEDPTAHLNLNYDHPGGWYAGASLAGVELQPGTRGAAITAYGGWARRQGPGQAWEAGAIWNHFSGVASYDYGEVHAGFIAERWTARVYLSPDYFGRGVRTIYAEFNCALALASDLRTFAHLGVLAPLAGDTTAGAAQTRYDARVGLGLRVAAFDVRLAWVDSSHSVPYAGKYDQRRSTMVLSASHDF